MIYIFNSNNGSFCAMCDKEPSKEEGYIYIESDTIYDLTRVSLVCNNNQIIATDIEQQELSVDSVKQSKLEELNQVAYGKYIQGFKSDAHQGTEMYYDSDTDKQREISQVAGITEDLFTKFFPKGFPIRARLTQDADKQVLHLTLSEMHKLCADMLAWCETVKFYVWLYQSKINKCETQEELDAIVFEFPNEVINKVTTMYDTGGGN